MMRPTQMEYRSLGSSSLKVSAISYGGLYTFGCKLQDAEAKSILRRLYESGVNFFDNGEFYGGSSGRAEAVMGRAIKDLGWKRSDYVLATNIGSQDSRAVNTLHSRKRLIEIAKASIEKLQVEYLDLAYCTEPESPKSIEEVVRAMNFLIEDGLIHYWGTSYWCPNNIQMAQQIAKDRGLIGPVAAHSRYNILFTSQVENDYASLGDDIGIVTCNALYDGVLSGKYSRGIPPGSRLDHRGIGLKNFGSPTEIRKLVDNLKTAGKGMKIGSSVEVALGYCLANERVSSVIIGASNQMQVERSLHAIETYRNIKLPEIKTIASEISIW